MAQHIPPQALFVVLKNRKVAYSIMFGMSPKFMHEEQKATRKFPSFSVKFQDIFTHPPESFQCSRLSRYGKLNP